jgi:predicted ArsR family transcriptional regulator
MRLMDEDLDRVAALGEPLRRTLYFLAASTERGLTRDQGAAQAGVARSVAAFHLDKLAEAGLLDVEYRRPDGAGGPGAGRPAKWYRRSNLQVEVSLPQRRYDLASEVLAEAIERAGTGQALPHALDEAAIAKGTELGSLAHNTGDRTPDALGRLTGVLTRQGYEPRSEGTDVILANCPFHDLAERHRHLVCSINHTMLAAAAEEAGLPPGTARLDPQPGRCCIRLAAPPRRRSRHPKRRPSPQERKI